MNDKGSGRTGGNRLRQTVVSGFAALGALVLGLALLGALGALGIGSASAEPYFTVRDGYKCSKCHVNKTGGGKRTDYAKVYMATRMAMSGAEKTGDGQSAAAQVGHGRLSDFFSITGDLRQTAEYRHVQESEAHWQFGQQGSCEGCHTSNEGGGKVAEIYEQLELMPGKASIVMGQSLMPNMSTREAFGLVELGFLDGWVKAGVFRMPTGFRNTWDDPYYHTTLNGGNADMVGLTAVRGDGVEFGIEPGPFSVTVSVTNPGALTAESSAPTIGKRVYVSAYAVSSLGVAGVILYQDPLTTTKERDFKGAYLGTSVGRITAMGEVDMIDESNPVTGAKTSMWGLLGELDLLLTRGQNIKLQYEAFDPDTDVDQNISDRTSLIYEPFVAPYLQVRVGARRMVGPREEPTLNGGSVFAELHLMY